MSRFGIGKPTAIAVAPKQATPTHTTVTHEAIAKRAYQIWVSRGKPEGQCERNWLEAEAELRAGQHTWR